MTKQKVVALDLSDPAVRRLAEINHQPRERWSYDGTLASLECWMCYRPWPCETRRAFDALKGEQEARASVLDECERLDAIADARLASTEGDPGSLQRWHAKGVKVATRNIRHVLAGDEPDWPDPAELDALKGEG